MYDKTFTLLAFLVLSMIYGCGSTNSDSSDRNVSVDSLNKAAYRMRFVSLDSTSLLAEKALKYSESGTTCKAEALANMGFVKYMQMNYEEAKRLYGECYEEGENDAIRLSACVGMMKIYQVTSQNKDYYDWAMKSESLVEKLKGEEAEDDLWLNYGLSEYYMASATFYDVQLQDREARTSLREIRDNMNWLENDTAQLARFYTLYGSVGPGGSDINSRLQYLTQAYLTAHQRGLKYMEAYALQKMADMLIHDNSVVGAFAAFRNLWGIGYEGDSLGLMMAEKALSLYKEYGSIYSRGLAYMTISSWYLKQGEPSIALDSALQAARLAGIKDEEASDITNRSEALLPLDWIGKIHEHLSIVYAMLGDKNRSDNHRNCYLDILDETRQDKRLEERKAKLERDRTELMWWRSLVSIVCGLIVIGLVFATLLIRRRRHDKRMRIEELRREERAMLELRLERNKRSYIDKCTSLSIANGIVPFLSRGIRAIQDAQTASENKREEYVGYAKELFGKINDYNEVLTHWIKIRQGIVKLHVESFDLQPLFDTLKSKNNSFQKKGLELKVDSTTSCVKADKVLTLFMLNTLIDNAWKFTDTGYVELKAEDKTDCVEISVTDTGIGMELSDEEKYSGRKGSGFGLMNCRGIIEKYKKTSRQFDVCRFDIESTPGKGSRFSFRLPKGILTAILLITTWIGVEAESRIRLLDMDIPKDKELIQAHRWADSTFYANVRGDYQGAIEFGDSVIECLNNYYLKIRPEDSRLMVMHGGRYMPELDWWNEGVVTDYITLLDVRNEIAISALALGNISLYEYNNKVYARLFRLCGQDRSLADYCETLQKTNSDMRWVIVLAIVLVILGLGAYLAIQRYLYRLASELHDEENKRIEYEDNNLHVQNMVLDNCLSTIKHETMYYPPRILSMLSDENCDLNEAKELAQYYEKMYMTLSQHAMSQLEKIPFKRRAIACSSLLNYFTERTGEPTTNDQNAKVGGDEEMLRYMIDNLVDVAKESGELGGKVKFYFVMSAGFVKFAFEIENLKLQREEVENIFYPDRLKYDKLRDVLIGSQFIICKQIIREHDDHCGHRGCRIFAEQMDGGGTRIVFLLPEG